MSANSKIEWTDHTFNPWIGCTKVSPGCANCYAEAREDRRLHRVKWGKGQPRLRTSVKNWREPLKWNETPHVCPLCGEMYRDPVLCMCQGRRTPTRRARVFCASLADWLDDEVPTEWRADLLRLIFETPNLDWLLLTKRPENWVKLIRQARDYWFAREDAEKGQVASWLHVWSCGVQPGNVWIGTTVEDQTRADERIPQLLQIPAKVRFLSCEPMLGPVDVRDWLPWKSEHRAQGLPGVLAQQIRMTKDIPGIDWVICGGESGPGARPMHPEWARSLRDQCAAAGVDFFFKQWGEWLPSDQYQEHHRQCRETAQHSFDLDVHSFRVGKAMAGRLLDGVEHNAFPV